MTLVVADIYCGAGGLSAGFAAALPRWETQEDEGFTIAYGVDRDPDAIQTFRAYHFPDLPAADQARKAPCLDIAVATPETILAAIHPFDHVDVLIGGPNCQGVSAAGLRNPGDGRNGMLGKFIELVRALQPTWFVMENVPGLTHANNRELLAEILREFEAIGDDAGRHYTVQADVLLAADYGVPQLRHRLFVVGNKAGLPIRFPLRTHRPPGPPAELGEDALTEYVTVEDAIGDLRTRPPQAYGEADTPQDDPANPGPHNHYQLRLSEENRRRIAAISSGKDWRAMPVALLPERYFATRVSDQKGSYGRLSWDWLAYTITNAVSNVTAGPFTHPDHDRALSVREAATLQSFAPNHVFHGDVQSQYRQVGNAVPPRLAQAVAEAILFCHYHPDQARESGQPGRLTREVVDNAVAGRGVMPVLTPRFVEPGEDRRARRHPRPARRRPTTPAPASAWEMEPRPANPHPELFAQLRALAGQPRNYRAAKRAQAIVQFFEGIPKAQIIADAHASETSVKKWVDGYYQAGLEGWRAYHTPVGQMTDVVEVQQRFEAATARVRELDTTLAADANGRQPRRFYMNPYLQDLIARFGQYSVHELIDQVETEAGIAVGTVYVGDLLAICDVVLDPEQAAEEAQPTENPPVEQLHMPAPDAAALELNEPALR